MGDSVPLSDVLVVLKAKNVTYACMDRARNAYLIAGNGRVEEIVFTDPVPKNRLHDLARKYAIAVHLFWHPEMLDYRSGEIPS